MALRGACQQAYWQSHAQQAPPAAQPTRVFGRPLQAGRSALGWEPHQLRDKAEGLVASAPTGLAGNNTEPLGRGTGGLGPPLSCSRGRECDVAAQCPADPVSDEVEGRRSRKIHAKSTRARQPLLWNDLALGSDGLRDGHRRRKYGSRIRVRLGISMKRQEGGSASAQGRYARRSASRVLPGEPAATQADVLQRLGGPRRHRSPSSPSRHRQIA